MKPVKWISAILAILLLFAVSPLFAASDAVIKDIKGKVQIKAPGRSWEAATENMKIQSGTTISTGFRSGAVLDLGASFVEIKALTRMTLEELLESDEVVKTDIYLNFGKVSAEVETETGKEQEFRLRSPVSTAAVRGTRLEYTMYKVKVIRGKVAASNKYKQKRMVTKGEETLIKKKAQPASLKKEKRKKFWVSPKTGQPLYPVKPGPSATGNVIIEW